MQSCILGNPNSCLTMGRVEELLVAEELWNDHKKLIFFPFSSAATYTNRPLEINQSRVWDSEPQPVGLFHRPEQASLLGQGGCCRPWSLRRLHLRRQIEVKRRYPSEKKELDRRNKNPPQAPPARRESLSACHHRCLLLCTSRLFRTPDRSQSHLNLEESGPSQPCIRKEKGRQVPARYVMALAERCAKLSQVPEFLEEPAFVEADFEEGDSVDDGLGVYLLDLDERDEPGDLGSEEEDPVSSYVDGTKRFDELTMAADDPTKEVNLGTEESPK
ncbi:hypothetical protein Taro_016930, partial [Colocasia esculenta]|nr:hypothetical protein [Colocasia esculenta]